MSRPGWLLKICSLSFPIPILTIQTGHGRNIMRVLLTVSAEVPENMTIAQLMRLVREAAEKYDKRALVHYLPGPPR